MRLLAEIYGELQALYWLPVLRSLGSDGAARVAGWQSAYSREGLGFGSSRDDASVLRRYVDAGHLTASGQTQGRTFRLTPAGLFTAMAAIGLKPCESLRRLEHIVDLEPAGTVSPWGSRLIMGWQLIESAGPWLTTATASDAAWKRYQHDLSELSTYLVPLLILGFVMLFADTLGHLWGCCITPAGRAVLSDWPATPEAAPDDCFSSWVTGYDTGIERFSRPPPPPFKNIVARCLPASKWY